MTEHGLDVDAGQIVHWLKDEQVAGRRRKLDTRATREYSTEPVADPDEAGIGAATANFGDGVVSSTYTYLSLIMKNY